MLLMKLLTEFNLMKYIVGLFFLTIFFSCNSSGALNEEERNEVITEVKQVMNAYFREVKDSGMMAELKYLDTSEDFFWAPPGYNSALSYDSVKTIIKRNATKPITNENVWETLKINPLTKKLAAYTGIIKASSIDTAGTVHTVRLIESGTVIKRKEGWKLLCGQTTLLQGK